MAKQEIAIEVEVQGVEQSIESVKDLKNAIKAAKDEQVKAAAAFGQGSDEYQNASKKLGELKDSMDDLNDSTQSLRGSGVESLSSSFGMLGDGFKNLDLDKIKTGFKGIGSAMSAIPLMLIVSGITMLAEKFGIFEMITDAVVQVLYAFTDAIGLTNKADEKAAAEMIENAENVQKAKEEQYNAEIKKAQAAGQSTKQLELDKLKSTEDSIAKQFKALQDLQIKKGELNDEEQKQYDELQVNLLKASGDRQAKEIANNKEARDKMNAYNTLSSDISEDLRVAKLSEREKEIDAINKIAAAKRKELGDKQSVDNEFAYKKLKETEKQINELAQIEINKINSKYGKEAADKKKEQDAILLAESDAFWNAELALQAGYERDAYMAKKAIEDKEKADADLLLAESDAFFAEQLADQEANRVLTYQAKKKAADDELAAYAELEKEKFNLTKQGLDGIQALSDMYFLFKSQKAQKGSKEEEELAKKAFNVNKALQLATATVNGIQSVQGAFTTATASPITTLLPAYPFIQAGLAGVFAAANIAKIAASKFGGGSGSVAPSGGAPTTPSIPPPPTIATPENNTNKTTSFDETGKNLNFQGTPTPTINVKASVGVDEITSKSNRVEVLENQSTF